MKIDGSHLDGPPRFAMAAFRESSCPRFLAAAAFRSTGLGASLPQVRVRGRLNICLVAGERGMYLLKSRPDEADLILLKGKFYLAAACHIPIRTYRRRRLPGRRHGGGSDRSGF